MKTVSYNGSALLYTLIVAALLACFCTALISMAGFQLSLHNRDACSERLGVLVADGVRAVLHGVVSDQGQVTVLPFDAAGDSLRISVAPWGLYQAGTVKAWHLTERGMVTEKRQFLIGTEPDSSAWAALYLVENNKPLTVAGNTIIRGDVFLPRAGIIKGFVNSEDFSRPQLFEGIRHNSSRMLPGWSMAGQIKSVLNAKPESSGYAVLADTVLRSFDDLSYWIHGKIIRLKSNEIRGNVVIKADSMIQVGKDARLTDVMLVAPVIRFAAGFTGTVQAFASEQIIVEKNVKLLYPSCLALIVDRPQVVGQTPCILMESGAVMFGTLAAFSAKVQNPPLRVELRSHSRITGRVVIDGLLQLEGAVAGNVTCNGFFLNTPSVAYDNYLWNAEIDAKARSKNWLDAWQPDHANKTETGIVKWLDY